MDKGKSSTKVYLGVFDEVEWVKTKEMISSFVSFLMVYRSLKSINLGKIKSILTFFCIDKVIWTK